MKGGLRTRVSKATRKLRSKTKRRRVKRKSYFCEGLGLKNHVYDFDLEKCVKKTAKRKKKNGKKRGGSAAAENETIAENEMTTESKPLFRIGIEIETCFRDKKSTNILGGGRSCKFKERDCDTSKPCSVECLTSTHDRDSLFKGVPELMAHCERDTDCSIELVINPNRVILYDGTELIDENNNDSIEDEFLKSLRDWHNQGIINCGADVGYPTGHSGPIGDIGPSVEKPLPSSCGVHIHISAPFMENISKTIQKLYKILIFYRWYNGVQDEFAEKNPNWVFGSAFASSAAADEQMSGWVNAPYIRKDELNFKLPDYETMVNMLITDPDENKELINYYYKGLPGANYSLWSHSRGERESNLIIVDKRYNNPYPRLEFRGHYDFKITYPEIKYKGKKNIKGVYANFKSYINEIHEFLSSSLDILHFLQPPGVQEEPSSSSAAAEDE